MCRILHLIRLYKKPRLSSLMAINSQCDVQGTGDVEYPSVQWILSLFAGIMQPERHANHTLPPSVGVAKG